MNRNIQPRRIAAVATAALWLATAHAQSAGAPLADAPSDIAPLASAPPDSAHLVNAPLASASLANAPLVIATPLSTPRARSTKWAYMKSAQDGLVAPTGLYANALVGGILGGWITSSAGQQIKQFQRVTAGTDWSQLAARDFACVGVPQGRKCRDVVMFTGDEQDLRARLHASGSSQAIVIILLQQFDGKRYRARATLREMDLSSNVPTVRRMFTTIYNSDAPEAIRKSATKMRDYWFSGATPFLQQEGQISLSQLSDMLNTLFASDRGERGAPEGWKDLKSINTLVASGRARCHGIACMGTREFADYGDHIWIVADGRSREAGWLLISLDRNAALRNANAQYQSLPIL